MSSSRTPTSRLSPADRGRRTPLQRWTAAALVVVLAGAFGATATSCGGGDGGGTDDLVLVSFNLPNIAGVPLNQPLIFTFSTAVDRSSITPDTLRVVGTQGPLFETPIVDGNLVGLLPKSPNFDDYSDAGMAPGIKYDVTLTVFPAASTIRSLEGRPLLAAEGFTFTTLPFVSFIEPRRELIHGLSPSHGGRSDDEGCLQNPENSLFVYPWSGGRVPCVDDPVPGSVQANSTCGGRLICLENEGSPHVLMGPDETLPKHGTLAVGTPNATKPGYIDLPAIRIKFNEPLDPRTVTPITSADLGVNIQLWRVADTDGNPLLPNPEQIRTNTPFPVQSLDQTEVVLVPSSEVLQGTYLVNVRPSVTDLPGNALTIADRPALVPPFSQIETAVNNSGAVPPGYRFYFVTLEIPNTPQAFSESFGNNLNEWGDSNSGTTEPGLFTESLTPTSPLSDLAVGLPYANYTLVNSVTGIGQSTSANWNGAFRFLNSPNVDVNADQDTGSGRLKATYRPHFGDGQDGILDTTLAPYGAGADQVTLSTDAVAGASINGDAIYEFERVRIGPGDTLQAAGQNPLIILCRGDFVVEGTIDLSGQPGGSGLDTDGSTLYTNPGAAVNFGAGGLPGPGGGVGGRGGDGFGTVNVGTGEDGVGPRRLELKGNTPEGFEAFPSVVGGTGGSAGDGVNSGGGGGGFGSAGADGTNAAATAAGNGGPTFGDGALRRAVSDFQPDRGYFPIAGTSGGSGGGGGGVEDDSGASEVGDNGRSNGDDGGGGGGGGGGGIWVIAGGDITVSGTIRAEGGAGGNTYNSANQQLSFGPDNAAGGGDDVIVGTIAGAVPSGDGAPGAGGSGGAVNLLAQENVTVSGEISTAGGLGGESGDLDRVGGDGGDGRIVLAYMSTGTGALDTTGAILVYGTLATAVGTGVSPTVEGASAGQTVWFDLSTPTALFEPAFYTTNFAFLATQGLTQGVHYDAVLEYQGADTLTPAPGGALPPSTALGLTQWNTDETSVNLKRYVRVRWRFNVTAGYPDTTVPLPAILDHTIPFSR